MYVKACVCVAKTAWSETPRGWIECVPYFRPIKLREKEKVTMLAACQKVRRVLFEKALFFGLVILACD